MIYRHRRWQVFGFAHQIFLEHEDILSPAMGWRELSEGISTSYTGIAMERAVAVWLNSLPRRGSMGLEPAWRPILPNSGQSISKLVMDYDNPVVQNYGVEFTHKRDALMFKLAFHNHKSPVERTPEHWVLLGNPQ